MSVRVERAVPEFGDNSLESLLAHDRDHVGGRGVESFGEADRVAKLACQFAQSLSALVQRPSFQVLARERGQVEWPRLALTRPTAADGSRVLLPTAICHLHASLLANCL